MIKNFFRIVFRNISKNKGFSIINVTGLAVGLAASLLILLWVQNELSYDKFNLKAENIFRVEENQFYSWERYHVTVTPHPSGPVWQEKIPEIKDQTRLNRLPRVLFRQDDKVFFESLVVGADSGLFRMFTFPFILGDPETVLRSPYSIVLTEKMAKKYFGDENPLGKTLTVENTFQFMVSGVMKDLPQNSIFNFEAVIPYSFLKQIGAISNSWGNNSIFTYVLLEKGADISAVNNKLTDVVIENNPLTTTKILLLAFALADTSYLSSILIRLAPGNVTAALKIVEDTWKQLIPEYPLQYTFIDQDYNNLFRTSIRLTGLLKYFTILAVIIACLGLYGLSSYSAERRTNEVGIRKVMGAGSGAVIYTLSKEFLILVIISIVIALPLGWIIVSNMLKQFAYRIDLSLLVLAAIATGAILIALITVSFQAYKATGVNPAEALKVE